MTTATEQTTTKTSFQDEDRVTVLHGWGQDRPEQKHYVDKTLFTGGVARDVPYAIAKHWQSGTRADGKIEQIVGKVHVHILPKDATEADFVKTTGVKPVAIKQFALQLAGVDLDSLISEIGIERARKLVEGLEQRLDTKEKATRQEDRSYLKSRNSLL
jgi:hypothetical protein